MGASEPVQNDLHAAFAAHATRLAGMTFPDAPRLGDRAPDFALPNARGRMTRLSDLLRRGPVVLVFYRGGWCPYCNAQLHDLQERLVEFEELGASLVAISPQTPDNSLSLVQKHSLTFEVLSDVNSYVASDYGIAFALTHNERDLFLGVGNDLTKVNGVDSWLLVAPSVFVIDRSRTVRAAHIDADYTRRTDPLAILEALHGIGG
jgi:peroxiredoxin